MTEQLSGELFVEFDGQTVALISRGVRIELTGPIWDALCDFVSQVPEMRTEDWA